MGFDPIYKDWLPSLVISDPPKLSANSFNLAWILSVTPSNKFISLAVAVTSTLPNTRPWLSPLWDAIVKSLASVFTLLIVTLPFESAVTTLPGSDSPSVSISK